MTSAVSSTLRPMVGDEPMRPWWIEHELDDDGERLLDGEKPPVAKPGWSRKPDKRSIVYLLDRALERSRKADRARRAKPGESREVANNRARSGK